MISSKSFFEQEIIYNQYESRIEYFKNLIENKTVLHIGCGDWPIYNTNNNLHLKLCEKNKNIDGFDNNIETISIMKNHPIFLDLNLYSTLPDKKYDFILIPEVIEHVNNIEEFLLSFINCIHTKTQILITAPNAFCSIHFFRNITLPNKFTEIVHPDHNCWFSLYTLPNCIQKIFKKHNYLIKFLEIGTLEKNTMVFCLFSIEKNL